MNRAVVSLIAVCMLSAPALAEQQQRKPAFPVDKYKGIGRQSDFRAALPQERQGWQELHNRHAEKAIEHFQTALTTYAYLPAAYLGLGIAQERLKNLKEAEAAYRGAIKCDTSNWRPWKRLANMLYQQQRFSEARQALTNAISLRPPVKVRAQLDRMVQATEAALKNGHADEVSIPDQGEDIDE